MPATLTYTTRDFEAQRARIVALLRSVFPNWTDFTTASFGTILAEAPCFVGDALAFYLNSHAAETRISSATQRRNLLELVKLINYTPTLAAAATVEETVTATGLEKLCTIPAGNVVFKTDDGIEFQSLAPITLTPEAPTASVQLEHSKTRTQSYAGTGQRDQAVQLSEAGFLGVISVVGAASGAWTRAAGDRFLTARSGDKVYAITVDNNDKATIKFSDGISGQMPGDTLTIVYKTGGGAVGNVAPHSIRKVDGTVLDVAGNVVDLAVTNAHGASGGADRETLELIRQHAPVSLTNPTAAVGREDFEAHATTGVVGITRALMLNTDIHPEIERNTGRLYLVPTGTAPTIPFPTKKKLDEVRGLFVGTGRTRPRFPAPQTFALQVLPAVYLDLAVRAKVFLRRISGTETERAAMRATIRASIVRALVDYFDPVLADDTANPKMTFGYYLRAQSANESLVLGELPLSDVINAIRDVEGVLKVGASENDVTVDGWTVEHDPVSGADTTTRVINGAHSDISMSDHWFPRLRTAVGGVPDVVLIDGDTGRPL